MTELEGIRKKVLTDVYGKPGNFWDTHTRWIGPDRPPQWMIRMMGTSLAYNLIGVIAAVRMFLMRKQYDGIVTSGGSSGLFFAWLQRIFPWGRKLHVMVDCNWYQSKNALAHWFKKLRLSLATPSVHRYVVWASHEITDYSRVFGIPTQKLQYVPFHSTLEGYELSTADGDTIFAGGNYDRDYPLLVKAVQSLDCSVWIATTRPELLGGLTIPSHVRVEGTSAAGFRQAMASARMVVVPMADGLLHSGGQQTCLNAMLLGKPTIAVGRKWAVDLIEDRVDGLIVEYGDWIGLRTAIVELLKNPDLAASIARAGKKKAERFNTQATMEAVYQAVLTPIADGEGCSARMLIPIS